MSIGNIICIVIVVVLLFSAWLIVIEFYRARARKLGEMAADDLNKDETTSKELYDEPD